MKSIIITAALFDGLAFCMAAKATPIAYQFNIGLFVGRT